MINTVFDVHFMPS